MPYDGDSINRSVREYPSAQGLTSALRGRWTGMAGKARCPAHDDTNPSLDITEKNGRTVVICRVGCPQEAVLAQLRARGLWPERTAPTKPSRGTGKAKLGPPTAIYDYEDPEGTPRLRVTRHPPMPGKPKPFQQWRPDGNGGWRIGAPLLPEHRFLPYRLPEVIEAIGAERPVFVVEGEKDVDNGRTMLGITSTCNAGGASRNADSPKWRPEHAAYLKDADVIVIPDNDDPGRAHAEAVARSLQGIATRVRVLSLPGLQEKGDLSEWIAAGGTAEQLWALVEQAPDWTPPASGVDSVTDGIVSRVASAIRPEPVTWIWPQRIPRGKLSILGGHPGAGKTLLATYMAAVVSTGGQWADGTTAEAGNVVIVTAEDDAADTIVPRLMAHGANLDRVHILDAVRVEGRERMFSLVEDLERLEELLTRIGGASLMTLDVIDSYLGDTDTHRNAAVRGVLGPLKDMAAKHLLGILGLTHFRKSDADRAVLRFTGSIGLVGQARAGWIVTPEMDQEGEATGRHIFARAKGNVSADPGGLAYRIEGATVMSDTLAIPTARIAWDEGAVMMDADEALAPQGNEREDKRRALQDAMQFVTEYLGDKWCWSKALLKAAREAGISERTLERARQRLKCQRRRSPVTENWLVALPGVPWRDDKQDRQEDRQLDE